MDIFEIVEKSALVINTVFLLFVGIRYLQEVRRHRIEYEKLQLELEALKRATSAVSERIVRPSEQDLDRLVVVPISRRIQELSSFIHQDQSRSEAHAIETDLLRTTEAAARVLAESVERLRAFEAGMLEQHEAVFRDGSELMRQAISESLKNVHLELRINREVPATDRSSSGV